MFTLHHLLVSSALRQSIKTSHGQQYQKQFIRPRAL